MASLKLPSIDTKFIGRPSGLLAEVLDLVLPPEHVKATGDGFKTARSRFRYHRGARTDIPASAAALASRSS